MEKDSLRVPPQKRLYSLDVLRGLDMFMLVGGASLLWKLVALTGADVTGLHRTLMVHAEWEGFRIHDLIFPLFMFISGVAIPYSIETKLENQVPRKALILKIFKRMVLLIVLGMFYNGIFRDGFKDGRIASVLGQIGIAYFFASMIILGTSSILTGVSIIQLFIPVPGVGAGILTPEGCINGYIDRHILPGRLHKDIFDPEGFLCNISATGITLMGAITGNVLRYEKLNTYKKLGYLAAAGVAGIILALLLSPVYPVIKKCWTTTFNLLAGGISILLMVFFYLVIDHWKFKNWAFFLRVFGMNALFVYIFNHVVNISEINEFIFGWLSEPLGWLSLPSGNIRDVFFTLSELTLNFLLLYYMYVKKIFIRV
jgi:predicted acyltransferase